jgi:hypothetical protein
MLTYKSPEKPGEEGCMQFNKSAFWKSRNIIRHQQKVYTSKTLLQLVKSEIIMLIESIPRKLIQTRNFVNELLIVTTMKSRSKYSPSYFDLLFIVVTISV